MRAQLTRLDAWVYRMERIVVVVGLASLAALVLVGALQRLFGAGDTAVTVLLAVVRMLRFEVAVGTDAHRAIEVVAPFAWWLAFSALAYLGVRVADRRDPVPRARAGLYAVIGVIASYGLVRLVVRLLPDVTTWARPFAGVLALWVAFVGVSMAVRDGKHLSVKALEGALSPAIRRWTESASGLLGAAVCLALAAVAGRYVVFDYGAWARSGGEAGMPVGLDIPRWACVCVLPVSLTIAGLRILAGGLASVRGDGVAADVGEELVGELARRPAVERPSEVPTEVSGKLAAPVGAVAKPSEVETDVGGVPGPAKPSEVSTEVVAVVPPGGRDGASIAARQRRAAPGELVRGGNDVPIARRHRDAPRLPSQIPTDAHQSVGDAPGHEPGEGDSEREP